MSKNDETRKEVIRTFDKVVETNDDYDVKHVKMDFELVRKEKPKPKYAVGDILYNETSEWIAQVVMIVDGYYYLKVLKDFSEYFDVSGQEIVVSMETLEMEAELIAKGRLL